MIKGNATIELTNADGSKQVIEHHNLVTNAVNDMCLSVRGEMAAILKTVDNNASYAQSLFGGLLLFENALDSDADNYYIPSTAITGYASQDAYAGLDTRRGSFNELEGGIQEDGSYKFVWDFSTSQGNGTIKALGLCPNVMGQIGASEAAVSSEAKDFRKVKDPTAPFNANGYMLDSSVTDNYNYTIVAIKDDIAYAVYMPNIVYSSSTSAQHITKNGGILKLHKFKLGATDISLADRVGMARYLGVTDVTVPSEVLAQVTTSYDSLAFNFENDKIICWPCSRADIAANGTLKYFKISIPSLEISTFTFTNNSGREIETGYKGGAEGTKSDRLFIADDYIFIMAYNAIDSRQYYVVKASDNTQIKAVKNPDGTELIETARGSNITALYKVGNILAFSVTEIGGLSSNPKGTMYIVDLAAGLIKRSNATRISNYGAAVNFGNKIVWANVGPYLQFKLTVCPLVLTTKNNLDAEITKTASQTMKITYTLSESEE